jgi:hypothetical protein
MTHEDAHEHLVLIFVCKNWQCIHETGRACARRSSKQAPVTEGVGRYHGSGHRAFPIRDKINKVKRGNQDVARFLGRQQLERMPPSTQQNPGSFLPRKEKQNPVLNDQSNQNKQNEQTYRIANE